MLVAVELADELQHVGQAGEEVGGQRRHAEVEAVGRRARGNGVARGMGDENKSVYSRILHSRIVRRRGGAMLQMLLDGPFKSGGGG